MIFTALYIVLAHACSVLREVKFSTTARSLKRNEATRITQVGRFASSIKLL